RIAREAASRVDDGALVGLTGGTTTTEVARELLDRAGLTVVTNALNIAGELAIRSDLKLVVTGGTARPESYELVGPLAERALAEMHLHTAFVGVDGVTLDEGLTTHHEVEAHTNRVLLERARQVIVVADSSKLGLVAFARICPLSAVDELITDDAADPATISAIRDAGITVTTV
ncbi:MAG: alkaline phosphatase, partial [Actinomycetota bacterium]